MMLFLIQEPLGGNCGAKTELVLCAESPQFTKGLPVLSWVRYGDYLLFGRIVY